MILLKGAAVSAKIKIEIEDFIKKLNGFLPTLAIIRVGENPDDISYEKGATKKMLGFDIIVKHYTFSKDISNHDFLIEFEKINKDTAIDGILLLRPLPKTIDEKAIERMIDPDKDIDGIGPVNIAKVFSGEVSAYAPCTAEAVIEVLKLNDIELKGKAVTIVGRSMVVGKPLAMLMLKEDATVTICHTKTVDIKHVCKRADILVAAAGRAHMLDVEYVGQDAVVIDVGINVDKDGKLCGDVDTLSLEGVASMATPVPGGVGSVTTSVLAKHLCMAALKKLDIK